MASPLDRLRDLAERTPASRERFIDLLRAAAILAVVLGHWLVTVIGYDHGELTGRSALPDLRWAYPITWLVQVIPIFFLVGGYVNAASLTSAYRRGGNPAEWLTRRGGRLVRPTTTLILVLAGGALAARLVGADPARIRLVVWYASIPLWFLSAYLVVVLLAPLMYALHRRYGVGVPVALFVLTAVGDAARLTGHEGWGVGNSVFGWLLIHQMGFLWRNGRLPGRPRVLLPVLAGALGVLLLLTVVGPYPITMINVRGERPHNMAPPTVALLALATAQLAAVLLFRSRAERWLHRRGPWLVVAGLNTVVLTIFLWHITAAILLAGALHAAGLLPTPPVGSATWFLWRIPWLILLTVVLAVLVAVFGPMEFRSAGTARQRHEWLPARFAGPLGRPAPRLALAVIGFVLVALALLENGVLSRTTPTALGIPATALVGYLVGAALLRLLRIVPPAPPPPGPPSA